MSCNSGYAVGLLELGLTLLAELLRSFLDKLSRKIEGDCTKGNLLYD